MSWKKCKIQQEYYIITSTSFRVYTSHKTNIYISPHGLRNWQPKEFFKTKRFLKTLIYLQFYYYLQLFFYPLNAFMRCIINKTYLCSERALDLVLWLNFALLYLWQKDVSEWTLSREKKRGRQTDRAIEDTIHMCKYEAEGTTQIPISGGKNTAIVLTDVQWWGNCITRDNDTDISCTRTHARAHSEGGRSRWAGWSELQRRTGSTGTQILTLNLRDSTLPRPHLWAIPPTCAHTPLHQERHTTDQIAPLAACCCHGNSIFQKPPSKPVSLYDKRSLMDTATCVRGMEIWCPPENTKLRAALALCRCWPIFSASKSPSLSASRTLTF